MQQTIQYPNAEIAYNRFGQLLRNNGFALLNSIPKHRFRHRLIITPNIDFYCLYRKNTVQYGTFEKFNDFFVEFVKQNPQLRGHAESINEEVINKICLKKHDPTSEHYEKDLILIYIYKDAKIYFTYPFIFKKFAEKHNLFREHTAIDTEKQIGGGVKPIKEKTYHLPFNETFFTHFNNWLRLEATKYLFN